jgi:hypothetical protein
MRGKRRVGVAASNHHPMEAVRAIRALWLLLGVEGDAPAKVDGKPEHRKRDAFVLACSRVLELVDDLEALIVARHDDDARALLPVLFDRINWLWQCCEGLRVEQERDAARARTVAA